MICLLHLCVLPPFGSHNGPVAPVSCSRLKAECVCWMWSAPCIPVHFASGLRSFAGSWILYENCNEFTEKSGVLFSSALTLSRDCSLYTSDSLLSVDMTVAFGLSVHIGLHRRPVDMRDYVLCLLLLCFIQFVDDHMIADRLNDD